jgi:hypothetical protein
MMNKILPSSDKSQNLESGAIDSPWQPSWWQWLISALSGTVETEKQIAWLRKKEEEASRQHEQRMKELQQETEQLRKENERLALLESKIDGMFSKYGINSNPTNQPEEP